MSKNPTIPPRNPPRRFWRGALFVAAFLAAAAPVSPAFADNIPVRLGEHREYTRIVFDFDRLTAYKIDAGNGRITATFDTPDRLSAPAADGIDLLSNLKTAKPNSRTATLSAVIPQGAEVKHYRLMRKIVVDIYTPSRAAPKPAAPPVKTAATPAATPAVEKPVPKPVAEQPAPAQKTPEKETPEKTAAADTPASESVSKIENSLQQMAAVPVEAVIVDEPPTGPEPLTELPPTQIALTSLAPIRAAVFTRGNDLWLVTDSRTGSVGTPKPRGPLAGIVGTPRTVVFDGGTAYRYRMPDHTFVNVKKNNLTWQLDITPVPLQAPSRHVVRVEYDPASKQTKLLAPLEGTSKLLSFIDPEAGSKIYAVPAADPEARIDQARHFSDVNILPANAGMIIEPLADDIRVTRIEGYVILSAPNGMLATAAAGPAMVTEKSGSVDAQPRLFDFPNWRQGGLKLLSQNRRNLEQLIAEAPNETVRNELLMNLALLYFANNFGPETIGVLRLLEQRDPGMAQNPNFIALRGAAAAMAGHFKDALQDLSTPALQQHPEVSLWIGYAAAATEQWRMADRSFPADNTLLLQYPENISIPFTLYMAESALRLGRTDTARSLLSTLDPWSENMDTHHRAAIAYLKGEAARQEGRAEEAMRIWRPVADGLDRLYHAKASLALTNLELAQNKISLQDAIDRIDSLRFAWRGDGLEVQILHNLGLLKAQNKRYMDGLDDMHRAMRMADTLLEDTDVIRNSMRRVIEDIFIDKRAEGIAPLEAISIYTAYGDLMPTGTKGSLATLHFADFLIRMDLLQKAAELIDDQIRRGAPPQEEMPRLGAKLAAVYLLDSQPQKALGALERTERSSATPEIAEERLLLRARSLSQMKRTDDAIAALSGLDTPAARQLKADVLWRAGRWEAAAKAIESMLPADAAKLKPENAEMVIHAAVAYKLGGDRAGLRNLKSRFEAEMAKTAQRDIFGVVTRESSSTDLSDRETLLRIAGEVDMFKGFLKSYRSAGDGT